MINHKTSTQEIKESIFDNPEDKLILKEANEMAEEKTAHHTIEDKKGILGYHRFS